MEYFDLELRLRELEQSFGALTAAVAELTERFEELEDMLTDFDDLDDDEDEDEFEAYDENGWMSGDDEFLDN